MSYPEMCFAAERTGAIELRRDDVDVVFNREGEKIIPMTDIYDAISTGEYARAWTCEELWGMLGPEGHSQFCFQPIPNALGCALSYPVKNFSKVQYHASLVEALLFAVMYERGWLWDGKEFKEEK